jgi:carbon monoxide dehydrogenase subunit G
MSLLKKTLLVVGAFTVVLVAVGFMLPRHVRVERAVTIGAPAADVFPLINDFSNFNKWSPWAILDPAAQYAFEGPARGIGAKLSWVGDPATIGSGQQAIVASEPDRLVKIDITFGNRYGAMMTYRLAPEGSGTRVTWTVETDVGRNPVGRYFGLMFDVMIGGDCSRGLVRLKELAERGK